LRIIGGSLDDTELLHIDSGDPLLKTSFIVEADGDVTAAGKVTAASFDPPSDSTLKINVNPLENALDLVTQLNGVYFDWDTTINSGFNFEPGRNIGFFGQEVALVIPEAVSVNDSGLHFLSYDQLIPVLTEAIKELDTRDDSIITALQTEIDSMKSWLTQCCTNNSDSVMVCHNSQTLIISQSALQAHLNHGDSLGPCISAKYSGNGSANAPPHLEGSQRDEQRGASPADDLPLAGRSSEVAELRQNQPNPFSENTEISYYMPETASSGAIFIYDLQGKQVKRFDNLEKSDGSVSLWGRELYAGMFIYTLIVDGKDVGTKRMILTE